MRIHFVTLAAVLAIVGLSGATEALAQTPAPSRRPDVIFVPTPEVVVEAMLQVAGVTKNDTSTTWAVETAASR